ncbi:hypothetical protein [Wolbachia endosymbiont of Brugia pahangi]|uniref:hypothetical protein n=1 Tax=Wolbachia endosymbiont of Brugia pahangi TaxID=96495 RepID=UPI001435C7D3|nr:hypothetical protein [Wolbachia endosymbiont of Brugia pahangi]QIT36638.1 hypothetical protein WBP_0144 [Wolbachia endosymbiont of Brugia pahangi]
MFNLENDRLISQQAAIGAKIADIEKKTIRKKKNFEGFEQYKEFLIENTNLPKIPRAKNPEPKVGVTKKRRISFYHYYLLKQQHSLFSNYRVTFIK